MYDDNRFVVIIHTPTGMSHLDRKPRYHAYFINVLLETRDSER